MVGLLLAASVATAPDAEAAYRYWSYWRRAPGATGWTYAASGPGYRVPDGAVEGWRFQDYGSANPSDPPPRSSATFDQICASVAPAEGLKRVAITVDFGESGGVASHCVRTATSATGDEALAQRARDLNRPSPRYNSSGLLCAIDGKPPAPECGEQVESPRPAASTARPAPSRTTAPAAPPRPGSTTAAPPSARDAASASRTTPGTATATPQRTSHSATATTTSSAVASGEVAASGAADDPTLVLETPSRDTGGGGGLPVPTLLGAALVAGLGLATALRMRARS